MNSDRIIHWGIIGPGHIAEKFAADLQRVPGCTLTAIASRSYDRAKDFASRFHVPEFYGSYDEITNNPNVDIIYIATPHNLHCDNSLLCLSNGKAVLCEKPFAINLKEAQQMVTLARNNGVFLMEAFWSRFNPVIQIIKSIIDSNELGKIKLLKADFGFKSIYNPEGRVFNPLLGGGSLMDVGVYPLFLASLLLGKPEVIRAVAQLNQSGIDESCGITLKYENGAIAILSSSVVAGTEAEAQISCENGRIYLPARWYVPKKAQIIQNDKSDRLIEKDFEGFGYQFEAIEANKCLRESQIESPLLSHEFSLMQMSILDEIRKLCNIVYSADKD
jgi:predicted dehydrogenase